MMNWNEMQRNCQTNEEKAIFLAQETGMELIMAEEFLSSNNWNLAEALKGYGEHIKFENAKRSSKQLTYGQKNAKKIGRGFSVSNMQLLERARNKLVVEQAEVDEAHLEENFSILSRKSFVLPDISQFGKVLAAYVREDLISTQALTSLNAKGRLNWWAEIGACRKLFPLSTIGDGNCLLHAASLGMWGFHDRMLKLRKAVHLMLLNSNARKAIKRRWKYNLWRENMKNGNLMYNRDEWDEEWEEVVKLASERPHHFEASTGRKSRRISRTFYTGGTGKSGDELHEGENLDSLEAIHVYVLSNLLRRPIIVISEDMLKDSNGIDVAPIPFGGIYLPLEHEPEVCWKYPLVLAYDASHFSTLVAVEGEAIHRGERLSTSVPLMDSTLTLLPLRFLIDPGSTWDLVQDDGVKEEMDDLTYEETLSLMRKYLDAVKVTFANSTSPKNNNNNRNKMLRHVQDMLFEQPVNVLIAARLNMNDRPEHYREMIENYVSNARQRLKKSKVSKSKCLTSTCNMFASHEFNGYCLVCHERQLNRPKSKIENKFSHKAKESTIPTPALGETKSKLVESASYLCNITESLIQPDAVLSSGSPPLLGNTAELTDDTAFHSPQFGLTDIESSTSGGHPYQNVGIRCQSVGCKFYGSLDTKGYCSSCYRKFLQDGK